MSLTYKIIDHFDDFMKLKESWNNLVSESEIKHAFMKHEWFECWIKYLGDKNSIRIYTIWDNDRLLAVAPMQLVRKKIKKFTIDVLEFLSSGITPRCNFIVTDSVESDMLFDFIYKNKDYDWVMTFAMDSNLEITKKYILNT